MHGPDVPALLRLVLSLCDDLAVAFPVLSKGLQRDKKYISSRVEAEGLPFLTKTFPLMGKTFDRWLADESAPLSFDMCYLAPRFLEGVKNLIDGEMSVNDRATVYRWLRQIAYLVYKLEVPYTEEQLNEAYSSFVERDSELDTSDANLTGFNTGLASEFIGQALQGFNPRGLSPKHGPGAVATGETGDEKWAFKRYYRSVHRRFPWYDYLVPTPALWSADTNYALSWWKSLERLDYPTARVVAVPKDSRGPRLISEEPLELQYLQQGYLARLVPHLEERSPVSGFVNFTRQDINQRLALEASVSGAWSTIDLSDASDRVSDLLVHFLFPTEVYKDLRALRSYRTVLPNGTVVQLRKFAPMGSAICFPVEALCFWAVAKAAICESTAGGDGPVYVYGDDIVVPTEFHEAVCGRLESVGLKVNRQKSYHTGSFRESCGVDAWKGYIVTPTRLRRYPPSRHTDSESISNWVAVHNGLRDRGFDLTADAVFQQIDGVIRLPWNIPGNQLSFTDSALGHPSADPRNARFQFRWNPERSRQEVRCPAFVQRREQSHLTGWQRYHRDLLMMPREPDYWQPRRAVRLKSRWLSTDGSDG